MSLFYSAGQFGAAIPDSAVFRYEFEDDSDTSTAIDSWNNNDGAINGATYVTSPVAQGSLSLDFDGGNDSIAVGDVTSNLTAYTIKTHVNFDALDGNRTILTAWDTSASETEIWLRGESNGTIGFYHRDGSGTVTSINSNAKSTGTTYLAEAEWDDENSDGAMTLQIDGSTEASTTGVNGINNQPNEWNIGFNGQLSSEYLDGTLDDTRLQDAAVL